MELNVGKDNIQQIADGIYSLSQTKGGRVHAFLLDDPATGLTLIDTLYDEDAHVVKWALSAIKKPVIDNTVLTHAHRSHLGGLWALLLFPPLGATFCHKWEAPIVAGERKASRVGLIPKKPINAEVWGLQLALAAGLGGHEPVKVQNYLKDGDKVGPLTVIETPGHTPGSLSFYWEDRKALFVGDVLATWPEVEGEPLYGGWEGFTLDRSEHLKSINTLKRSFGTSFNSRVEIIGVGHGEPITKDAWELLQKVKFTK